MLCLHQMALQPVVVAVGGVFAVFAIIVQFSLHKIDEGHVGVYYRGGALLKSTSGPGFQIMLPILTSFRSVQVSLGHFHNDDISKISHNPSATERL